MSPGRWFADRPVSMKIMTVVAVVAVATLSIAYTGFTRLQTLDTKSRLLYTDSINPLVDLAAL
ncbi:MCP four helix bundle domain-containing protein [Actinoplanes couchii]|uniref:Chemotaxis methyl-accepting receptor HlyB-like 4HB MCP domain-containing protein n=1 Tax=Actinoplanes couchii TaxID=403638 RepID=A0ABQ3XRQ4_9ACTN|nr:hypothetical protein Aco03nite_095980 [Actinoplanes couchii]